MILQKSPLYLPPKSLYIYSFQIDTLSLCTDVQISLHLVVLSHYNDYLDRLSCRQGRGEVT